MKAKPQAKRVATKKPVANPVAKPPLPVSLEKPPRGAICRTCGRRFASLAEAQVERKRWCETCQKKPQRLLVETIGIGTSRGPLRNQVGRPKNHG